MKKMNVYNRWKDIPRKIKWPLLGVITVLLLAILGYTFILYGGSLIVNEDDMILNEKSIIESTDGEEIAPIYHENRRLIDINEVPNHVKNAFIAIEDRRFYQHGGIDFHSIVRAVLKDVIALGKVEGASTITQQLAKNLFLSSDKTFMRKTKEIMAAIYLERKLTKSQILGLYLNNMYFGKGIYGIETAAQYFFGKSCRDLSLEEGAMLAGLMKAPNGYSPIHHPKKALKRRNVVLKAMTTADMISTNDYMDAKEKTLGIDVKEEKIAPWSLSYVDLVMKEAAEKADLSIEALKRGGYRIVTNMNETAQKIAYHAFQSDKYFPGNTTGVQGAFTMMDQQTGGIIAVIGGRAFQLGDLNRATIKHQPGSTMKPLAVYAPAMMTGNFKPYSLLRDQEVTYDGGYTPKNHDDQYDKITSMYHALVQSKNAPAVWLLDLIGIPYAKGYLEKMRIKISDNGLAIALGGLKEGLTPIQMMQSYRPFIHSGEMILAHAINKIYDRQGKLIYQVNPKEKTIFQEQVAWNMTEMLQTVVTNGTGRAGYYPKALAGKTGTTQHPFVKGMVKDSWFVGYTPKYVSALWMGYDKTDKNHYLTGGSKYPTMLTKKILTEIDKRHSLQAHFTKPANVKALPKPVQLPDNIELQGKLAFGGLSLVRGKLTWNKGQDDRIVYLVYQRNKDQDLLVGKVTGKDSMMIDNINIFHSNQYYVVPYDPLTKTEGNRSNVVDLS